MGLCDVRKVSCSMGIWSGLMNRAVLWQSILPVTDDDLLGHLSQLS